MRYPIRSSRLVSLAILIAALLGTIASQAQTTRDDAQIGARERVRSVALDHVDPSHLDGRLFSVLAFDLAEGGNGWSVNFSADDGATWQETYAWTAEATINATHGRVGAGHLYVAFTTAGTAGNSAVHMRRFDLTDGSVDDAYGDVLVADYAAEVTEVVVETNVDGPDDHIYCLSVLADHTLALRTAAAPATLWTPVELGVADAAGGLSAHWSTGIAFLYASYRNIDDRVQVLRLFDGLPPTHDVVDLDTTAGPTSIAAKINEVMVAFEYAYPGGTGIRVQESPDGGASWGYEDLAVPAAGETYRRPAVAARGVAPFGLTYQQEGGGPDRVWFVHNFGPIGIPDLDGGHRDWSGPELVNEVDVQVGLPLAIEMLPPIVTEIAFAVGVIWIGGDTVDRGAFFQRFDYIPTGWPEITAWCAHDGPASVLTMPDGSGQPLNMCYGSGGTIVDATITVEILDSWGGNPIPYYPAEDVWLETSGDGLSLCPGGSIADHDTDIHGQTTISHPIYGGGNSSGETTHVLVSGAVLNQPGFPIMFNSPDINGDRIVNLTDLHLFALGFFGSYSYGCDLVWDGVLNLSDLSRMGAGLGRHCATVAAEALPEAGTVAVSFARDAVQSTLAVAPGETFAAYLLVSGPVTTKGLDGLQGRLHTTDNLEVVSWSFGDRQINVADAPDFTVGWAEPQVAKMAGPLCAATVMLRARDDRPASIHLSSTSNDDHSVLCASGGDATLGRLEGSGGVARVNEDGTAVAADALLVPGSLRNAPNPFNPSTDITFDLMQGGQVDVRIYDLNGRLVRRLAGATRSAGPGMVHWDGRDEAGTAVASGLYFSQLLVDGVNAGATNKMSLVR